MRPDRLLHALLHGIVALYALCAAPVGAAPELIDRITAVVDDEIILWSELNYRLQVVLQESGYRVLPAAAELDSLRGQVLKSMVDEQVLILKAEKDSIVVDESVVQELLAVRYNAVKEGMSESEYQIMLERSGLTERQLKARLRKQIRASELFKSMQQEVYYRTHVTRKDVEAYRQVYSEAQPPIISLSQIAVRVKPDTAALVAIEEKISGIQRQLAAGEDFAALARAHSEDPRTARDGGSLGCFSPGLVPEFEQAAMQLKPGEISEPVLTQLGYHLIRLDEKREDELCASHILIRASTSGQDRERVRQSLADLRQRALAGDDFGALARVHSEERQSAARGGLLGSFPQQAIPPHWQPHINPLKLGQISEPFFLEDMGYLIRVNDDQAVLENLIREERTAESMQQLIDDHKAEIHLDTRLGDGEQRQLGYAPP